MYPFIGEVSKIVFGGSNEKDPPFIIHGDQVQSCHLLEFKLENYLIPVHILD